LAKAVAAMSQISPSECNSLISKLLSERTPVHAFLKSATGTEARISGFVDSKTEDRLTVSTSGPPVDPKRGYFSILFGGRRCDLWYGERRELPAELQHISDVFGESALVINFSESGETLALFFTI